MLRLKNSASLALDDPCIAPLYDAKMCRKTILELLRHG
jgi:hypothetical protein